MNKLWTEFKVGKMNLPHRLAMAPMTRSLHMQMEHSGSYTYFIIHNELLSD